MNPTVRIGVRIGVNRANACRCPCPFNPHGLPSRRHAYAGTQVFSCRPGANPHGVVHDVFTMPVHNADSEVLPSCERMPV